MKDQKFTKGPWSANGLYISSPGKTSDIGQAFVKHNWDQLRGQKVEDVEANANALLIAAAPAMYEALQTILANFEANRGFGQDMTLLEINAGIGTIKRALPEFAPSPIQF